MFFFVIRAFLNMYHTQVSAMVDALISHQEMDAQAVNQDTNLQAVVKLSTMSKERVFLLRALR